MEAAGSEERPLLYQPGHVIQGRYKVIRRIGYGGIGDVYEVEHLAVLAHFALKVLHPKHLHRPEALERMTTMMNIEARVGAQLRRGKYASRLGAESIVHVFDAGTTEEGLPFFVMELLEGHTLNAQIKRRRKTKDPIRVAQALRLAMGVASVLLLLHEAKLVHCDLKPENVLLRPTGDVVVLDLGMVAWDGNPEPVRFLRCTPRFAAPEQLLLRPPRFSTDVYALGLLLYELLTLRGPFDGADGPLPETKAREAHVNWAVPPMRQFRADVPESVDGLVLSMLRKELGTEPERPLLADVFNRLRELLHVYGGTGGERADDLRELAAGMPAAAPDTESGRLVIPGSALAPQAPTPSSPSGAGILVPLRMPSTSSVPDRGSDGDRQREPMPAHVSRPAVAEREKNAVARRVTARGLAPPPAPPSGIGAGLPIAPATASASSVERARPPSGARNESRPAVVGDLRAVPGVNSPVSHLGDLDRHDTRIEPAPSIAVGAEAAPAPAEADSSSHERSRDLAHPSRPSVAGSQVQPVVIALAPASVEAVSESLPFAGGKHPWIDTCATDPDPRPPFVDHVPPSVATPAPEPPDETSGTSLATASGARSESSAEPASGDRAQKALSPDDVWVDSPFADLHADNPPAPDGARRAATEATSDLPPASAHPHSSRASDASDSDTALALRSAGHGRTLWRESPIPWFHEEPAAVILPSTALRAGRPSLPPPREPVVVAIEGAAFSWRAVALAVVAALVILGVEALYLRYLHRL